MQFAADCACDDLAGACLLVEHVLNLADVKWVRKSGGWVLGDLVGCSDDFEGERFSLRRSGRELGFNVSCSEEEVRFFGEGRWSCVFALPKNDGEGCDFALLGGNLRCISSDDVNSSKVEFEWFWKSIEGCIALDDFCKNYLGPSS